MFFDDVDSTAPMSDGTGASTDESGAQQDGGEQAAS